MSESEGVMRRKIPALPLFLTLTSILFAPGCATWIGEKTQLIPVTSTPPLAQVYVNGERQGQTPCYLMLSKNKRGQVIRIESRGYNPLEIHTKRRLAPSYFLMNLMLGGFIGGVMAYAAAVGDDEANSCGEFAKYGSLGFAALSLSDLASNKAYGLNPKELTVTLTRSNGPPRVDMMLVDAEDFQTIRWIRVHRD